MRWGRSYLVLVLALLFGSKSVAASYIDTLSTVAAAAVNESTFTHLSGTSAPSGWTFAGAGLTDGAGGMCMNGTLISGSGTSCPGAVTDESFLNAVTASATDAALAYRTEPVDFNESRIFRIKFRNSAGNSYIWLYEGTPIEGTNAAVFAGSGKTLMRVATQNSGANIGIDRYNNARTRTQWQTNTSTWENPTVNATTTLAATYQEVIIEIDGPNRRWRVGIVGQTGTANTPSASLYLAALSDWVLFSFHEGAGTYCNPTCGTTYLAIGEPITDSATGTTYYEYIAEQAGTKSDWWLNGRNAGGSWDIYHYTSLPDVNGVPAQLMPEDRTTVAVGRGGAGAWDENQVKDPYVILDGSTYHMMYSGARASDGKFQCGAASSSSASGAWTKNANNPIIALSAGTQEDQAFNCTLVKDEAEADSNKRWKIVYVGTDTSSPLRFRVFVRTCSQPPTHTNCDTAAEWSSSTLIWDTGGSGAIDEIGAGRVLPMRIGSTNYLFAGVRALSGGSAQNRQETYATTSDRWLSAVSKSGTITNGSASSNCNTTTTAAITTTGSRTFTVASTTGCNPDDMVIVDDDSNTGNYHVNRILRVASATSLVMYHNEDSLASGARVRSPNAFWQIDVGPIVTIPTGFAKIATCFDPMSGGGSTFDAYAELTCIWTSSSALGPWTLYGLGSPATPLSGFGRAASNENPSKVNLPLTE